MKKAKKRHTHFRDTKCTTDRLTPICSRGVLLPYGTVVYAVKRASSESWVGGLKLSHVVHGVDRIGTNSVARFNGLTNDA
jgi:hypothetical protein